ncbi:extracellular solute-binding protein [Pararhodobacter aggregans]|uniref:Fe(3+) ABC transporter substrate-binding protein n=1 Tax=Pararhodobacter aggregans TaxID=404875 RepID=A0A2T7UQT2_9RHOB|nr:extracellular solute-binding protein [Pararhodobacter aggregans]PTX01817.1 iron(III) transport system substrate-binding protein [Pararhodobacter aggregans]PVE47016.1 Fe(3+) ABC transporter substrate-binding protein [Pararhodobacter aggregans]
MFRSLTALGLIAALASPALAQEINLYSSRHYDTDLRLYENFTAATGIRINLIEGEGEQLMERIRTEGANSPADIFVTVDGGRLHRAVEAGIFQPIESAVLEERVPANFQHPDNLWFGLSSRARVIFTRTGERPDWLDDYEDLADPRLAGEICIRSSSNVYNVSLMAELIEVLGAEAAEEWAAGVNANLARAPQGGDRDQLRALAAGECSVAVSNTYYWGALAASENPDDRAVAEAVEFFYPNQGTEAEPGRGAHVNISGAGVVAGAPNRENAIRFLEYLVSDEAQAIFADSNNEFPIVPGVEIHGPVAPFTEFRNSGVNVSVYGLNAALATDIFDRVGFP